MEELTLVDGRENVVDLQRRFLNDTSKGGNNAGLSKSREAATVPGEARTASSGYQGWRVAGAS
jgi:hypothetical protein